MHVHARAKDKSSYFSRILQEKNQNPLKRRCYRDIILPDIFENKDGRKVVLLMKKRSENATDARQSTPAATKPGVPHHTTQTDAAATSKP